jgi:hypothetical protein
MAGHRKDRKNLHGVELIMISTLAVESRQHARCDILAKILIRQHYC